MIDIGGLGLSILAAVCNGSFGMFQKLKRVEQAQVQLFTGYCSAETSLTLAHLHVGKWLLWCDACGTMLGHWEG